MVFPGFDSLALTISKLLFISHSIGSIMFFHFHEPLGFLNAPNDSSDPFGTRSVQFESSTERASGLLYGLTYWGDYGGDSVSRYHFDTIRDNAPHLVRSIEGNYGQGLILDSGAIGASLAEFDSERRWLAEFFRWAVDGSRDDYFIFDESDYSDWEWHKQDEILAEDIAGWLGSDVRSEFSSSRGIADSDLEFSDQDILHAIGNICEGADESPYWESATSVVYPGTSRDIAEQMLDNYARTLIPRQDDNLF